MRVYALRLHPGQDLKHELIQFTRERWLQAGFILTCVGSVQRAALRLADQSETTYYEGKFEIVSLVGTLSPDGVHLHLALANHAGTMFGGHMQEGCVIYTTAEIVIGEAETLSFRREPDPQTGYTELVIRSR